ncbi:MAG TPA: cryptochrome/photolyase family protein [Kiritimatiellia bacterium]|nr:cryptochrome/photolyase family protein [Kiritimatiellia bacterium]
MTDLALIFPHQLFDPHPALASGRPVLLVEDSLFFGDRHAPARFHRQKLLFHRASMSAYAERLRRAGHRVELAHYDPAQTARERVAALAARGVRALHLADPVDFLLEKRLRESARQHGVSLHVSPSPMFLTDPAWAAEFFERRGRYRMADFYQAQRRRLNVLLQDGAPVGGQWSFDADNRKPLPRGLTPPAFEHVELPRAQARLAREVAHAFPEHPGDTEDFWFPVTHEAARKGLDSFLEHRFARFGDFEDAISAQHPVLFHSVLTPALNSGLLTPAEVLSRALEFAREHPVPLNALEGFIRQLIGWREFIRVLYVREGVRMRRGNFWGHERPLPKSFYTGETGIDPLDAVIRRVNRLAWCHHIERLMVAGNLMVLCGIRPDDAYRWFMELFIDAYDWVMVPNVYGMALFADGGVFATKPYISGSAYIRRMSDFAPGPWCAVWDALFWNFIGAHRDYFIAQPRLSMMARTWDKLGAAKRAEHRRVAERFLDGLK